jgi:cytochrome c biogenesis protein CcmG/thiol:disulfide interchange protein DsbE
MKLILFSVLASLLLSNSSVYAQKNLPDVNVKTLEGEEVSASAFDNDGKPIVVHFWATWCKPCILELNTIDEEYADWQEETGVKIIIVSIDDARNAAKVKPFVSGKGWTYEVYSDVNGTLKEAMGVENVPHSFLLDGNKNIVWEADSFSPGDEVILYDKIKEVAGK